MNKDEILEKSRKENMAADEREGSIKQTSCLISVVVGFIVCMIFYLLENNSTYFIILLAMSCVAELYLAIKLKKAYNIILALILFVSLGIWIAAYLSDRGLY